MSLNNLAPDYISDMISPASQIKYGTRRNEDAFLLATPPPPSHIKTNAAFYYSAPTVWNVLPYHIRSSCELKKFKSSLKTHYFQLAFKDSDDAYNDIEMITY